MEREPNKGDIEASGEAQAQNRKLFWVAVGFLFDFDKQSDISSRSLGKNTFNLSRNWQIQTADLPEPEHLNALGVETIDFIYLPEKQFEIVSYPEAIDIRINDTAADSRRHYLLKVKNAGLDEEVDVSRMITDANDDMQSTAANQEDIYYLDGVLFALRDSYPKPLATP